MTNDLIIKKHTIAVIPAKAGIQCITADYI
jgi:hypothetical protein